MQSTNRSLCPVACILDLIGDRWTLLVIRDMMFFKKQRFEEFLESAEGISTNILADRLKSLEGFGLVEKHSYSRHSRRMNYQLTKEGESLRPVIKIMAEWGLNHIERTHVPSEFH
jgi:DNA-binding HxlR family transcriptional regulator